jgi:HK97 family phage portal protein
VIVSNGTTLDFAPQALGETVPSLSNGYFYAAQGLELSGKFATYAALYKVQPIVATLVDKIAVAAARLTVKVWDNTPKTGKIQDLTSTFARLMADPCTVMSPFNFYRWTFSTYEIYGESFWYKVRDPNGPSVETEHGTRLTGKVVNLLPMHPSRTAVHRNAFGAVEYIFTLGVASAGILHAPAEDVVAFLRYNPDSLMRGLSRLEPLRTTLLNEDAARRAMTSFWKRGLRPSTVVTHPGDLSQDAKDRLKASIDARHAGVDNMGGSQILDEGMTMAVIQLNAEEMQYIEARKVDMQEGCMVYDVPPPVVHILDHATFSNITEQMRSMYRDTMTGRLEDWESVIDFSLRPEFFPIGQRSASFDMTDVLRGDFETRAEKAVVLRNAGIYTGNECRELVGLALSIDPAMDKLFANAALQELGTPMRRVSITESANPTPAMAAEADATAAGAVDASANDQAAKAITRRGGARPPRMKATTKDIRSGLVAGHQVELDKFFARQRASVKAAVGKKAAGVFDPSAWDGDLATVMHSLSAATAKAIGAKVAADLGGTYDGADIADWLAVNSKATAKRINATTADEITAALENAAEDEDPTDTIDGLFDGEVAARSSQIALTAVAVVGGLASQVAARQSGAKTKTWVVTSGNPRSLHSAMSGETVLLGETFSNGMDGPGDFSGGADEVAGCQCDLSFSTEG